MNAKFAHISDIHLFMKKYVYKNTEYETNALFGELLKEIETKHSDIDFAIISGDLVDNGSKEGYEYLKKVLETSMKKPVYLCLGNHDNRKNFNNVFLNKDTDDSYYYSEELMGGTLRLICLDSGMVTPWMGTINEEQLTWLDGELGKSNMPTIIFTHHPVFIGEDIDSLLYQLENGLQVYNVINRHDIIGMFSGHVHGSYSYALGNIPCYTAGSAGFGLEFDNDCNSILTADRSFNICTLKNGRLVVKRHGLL